MEVEKAQSNFVLPPGYLLLELNSCRAAGCISNIFTESGSEQRLV